MKENEHSDTPKQARLFALYNKHFLYKLLYTLVTRFLVNKNNENWKIFGTQSFFVVFQFFLYLIQLIRLILMPVVLSYKLHQFHCKIL